MDFILVLRKVSPSFRIEMMEFGLQLLEFMSMNNLGASE